MKLMRILYGITAIIYWKINCTDSELDAITLLKVRGGKGVSFLDLWDLAGVSTGSVSDDVFRSGIIDNGFTEHCPEMLKMKFISSTRTFDILFNCPQAGAKGINIEDCLTSTVVNHPFNTNVSQLVLPYQGNLFQIQMSDDITKVFLSIFHLENRHPYPMYLYVNSNPVTVYSISDHVNEFSKSDVLEIIGHYNTEVGNCDLTDRSQLTEICDVLPQIGVQPGPGCPTVSDNSGTDIEVTTASSKTQTDPTTERSESTTQSQTDTTTEPPAATTQPQTDTTTEPPAATTQPQSDTTTEATVTTQPQADTSESVEATTQPQTDTSTEPPAATTQPQTDTTTASPEATTETNTTEPPVATTQPQTDSTTESPEATTETDTTEPPVATAQLQTDTTKESPEATTETDTTVPPAVTTQAKTETTESGEATTQLQTDKSTEPSAATTQPQTDTTTESPEATTETDTTEPPVATAQLQTDTTKESPEATTETDTTVPPAVTTQAKTETTESGEATTQLQTDKSTEPSAATTQPQTDTTTESPEATTETDTTESPVATTQPQTDTTKESPEATTETDTTVPPAVTTQAKTENTESGEATTQPQTDISTEPPAATIQTQTDTATKHPSPTPQLPTSTLQWKTTSSTKEQTTTDEGIKSTALDITTEMDQGLVSSTIETTTWSVPTTLGTSKKQAGSTTMKINVKPGFLFPFFTTPPPTSATQTCPMYIDSLYKKSEATDELIKNGDEVWTKAKISLIQCALECNMDSANCKSFYFDKSTNMCTGLKHFQTAQDKPKESIHYKLVVDTQSDNPSITLQDIPT